MNVKAKTWEICNVVVGFCVAMMALIGAALFSIMGIGVAVVGATWPFLVGLASIVIIFRACGG